MRTTAGRATGKKVAQILLRDLGLDPDDPSLIDRAMNIRAGINGDERFPFEPKKNRAEHLYEAWDKGFWETFDAARQALADAHYRMPEDRDELPETHPARSPTSS